MAIQANFFQSVCRPQKLDELDTKVKLNLFCFVQHKIKFFFVQRRIKIYFAQRRNNSSLHKSRGNFRATSSAVIMSSALLSDSLLLTMSPYAPLPIHPLATQLRF